MPIYEYRCSACGHHLEALQKMADAPLRKCPDCGKSQLKRLVSASRFRLKGGGWYETDFKGDKEKKRNLVEAAAGEAGAAGDAKTDGATDTTAKADSGAKADGADGAAKPKPEPVKTKTPAAKKPTKPRATRSARA